MTVVVDASVACKWLVPESDSAIAERVIVADEPLIAPTLIIAECGNIFWRKNRIGEITAAQATTALNRLPVFFSELIPVVDLRDRALAIAMALDHPIYDAFYLALAERFDCRLVSVDQKLKNRVAGKPWESLLIGPESFV